MTRGQIWDPGQRVSARGGVQRSIFPPTPLLGNRAPSSPKSQYEVSQEGGPA